MLKHLVDENATRIAKVGKKFDHFSDFSVHGVFHLQCTLQQDPVFAQVLTELGHFQRTPGVTFVDDVVLDPLIFYGFHHLQVVVLVFGPMGEECSHFPMKSSISQIGFYRLHKPRVLRHAGEGDNVVGPSGCPIQCICNEIGHERYFHNIFYKLGGGLSTSCHHHDFLPCSRGFFKCFL